MGPTKLHVVFGVFDKADKPIREGGGCGLGGSPLLFHLEYKLNCRGFSQRPLWAEVTASSPPWAPCAWS